MPTKKKIVKKKKKKSSNKTPTDKELLRMIDEKKLGKGANVSNTGKKKASKKKGKK